MSSHAGCPVVKGVKFSATKWMHVAPIEDSATASVRFEPGVCKDVNAACEGWASSVSARKIHRSWLGEVVRTATACARAAPARPALATSRIEDA